MLNLWTLLTIVGNKKKKNNMKAIEQKLLNKYQQFVDENGTHTPLAVNVLVRNANGTIGEDCIFITKDGKPCMYGTQTVAHVNEIIPCLSNIDFLPEDYDTISYPLRELGWELGEYINPVMYTAKEWESSKFTPFYHNVIDDAIRLA